MQAWFVSLLICGIIALILGTGLMWISESSDEEAEKEWAALALIAMGALSLCISWYNAGQLNKQLPNLKSHACSEEKHLNYRLGEKYQKDVANLLKAQRNTKCTGRIVVQYPGNNPITIPLK